MKRAFVIFGFAAAALIALPVMATPINTTVELGRVYTGTTPSGTAPWLKATFDGQTGSTTGTLTLTSHLTGSDFVQGGKKAKGNVGWGFSIADLTDITCTSGSCPDNSSFGGDYNTGPVKGVFNLAFKWSSKDRFSTGDSAVFDLTFSDALTGDPFADPTYLSVAHVQGIGIRECSGWIVNGSGERVTDVTTCRDPTNVPEPAALGTFGLGVLLIGLFVGLRRRLD